MGIFQTSAFARRVDETQPYMARDIRDILINCPPQRRITKVHYSTQNTRLREDEIPGATEKRLAYIEALYALALEYKEALLAELVASEPPVSTLDQTIRSRFDDAIDVLRGVDAQHPGMSLMSFAYISYVKPENTLPDVKKEMWDWSLSQFLDLVIGKLEKKIWLALNCISLFLNGFMMTLVFHPCGWVRLHLQGFMRNMD